MNGERQDGAAGRVLAWMDGCIDEIDRDDVREVYVTADRASHDLAGAIGELRRTQAERDALAARIAELESERKADTALIGPLTAAEWCAFRLRLDSPDGDLLRCCAVTSEFRDALFDTLRGGAARQQAWRLEDEWAALLHHGLPEGVPQMETIRDFYGLPAAPGKSAVPAGDETDGSGT